MNSVAIAFPAKTEGTLKGRWWRYCLLGLGLTGVLSFAAMGLMFAIALAQAPSRTLQLELLNEARNRLLFPQYPELQQGPSFSIVINPASITVTQPWLPSPLTYSLFFANGDASLDPAIGTRLEGLFKQTAACRGGVVRVRGWASSAGWKKDTDGLDKSNVDLAHRRRDAVAARISRAAPIAWSIVPVTWENAEDMHQRREIPDVRSNVGREHPFELFNRRVDVEILNMPSC